MVYGVGFRVRDILREVFVCSVGQHTVCVCVSGRHGDRVTEYHVIPVHVARLCIIQMLLLSAPPASGRAGGAAVGARRGVGMRNRLS